MLTIFGIFNFVASFCSIISLILMYKGFRQKFTQVMIIINITLLIIVGTMSFSIFKSVDAKNRAADFHDRYATTSFDSDFPDNKIKIVVTDGIIIMNDLNFKEKYPDIYSNITAKYKEAESSEFEREKYVEIARELFGAFGSISDKLYKTKYYSN